MNVLVMGTALTFVSCAEGVPTAGSVLALNVLVIGTVLTVLQFATATGIAEQAGEIMERDLQKGPLDNA